MPLSPAQQKAIKDQTGNIASFEAAIEKEYGTLNSETLQKKAIAAPVMEQILGKLSEYEKKLEAYRTNLLKGAPQDDAEVVALLARMDKSKERLADLRKGLEAAKGNSAAAGDLSKYPNYQKDVERIQGMEDTFKMPAGLESLDVESVKELESHFKDNADFVNAVTKNYAPLINLKTPEGMALVKYHEATAKKMINYTNKREEFITGAQAKFDAAVSQAHETMKRAVEQKAPQLFVSGIRSAMRQAEDILNYAEALQTDKAKPLAAALKTAFDQLQAEVSKEQASQKEAITAATQKPEDTYKGADRADLEKQVREAWAKKYPQDQILGVHFSMPEWKRTDRKQWNSQAIGWDLVSFSELSSRVVVKTSDTVATIYVAMFRKDHTQNDRITLNVDTKGGIYMVEEMLVANYK